MQTTCIATMNQDWLSTGSVQTFTAPVSGVYQVQVWGAEGAGDSNSSVSNPGYACATINFTKGQIIYVEVGGKGATGVATRAYNGGGKAEIGLGDKGWASGGGGCTHIATKAGELKSFGNSTEAEKYVFIVAGGSGATSDGAAARGYGGGLNAQDGTSGAKGGTQTSGYRFGQGEDAWRNVTNSEGTEYAQGPGGGGGWYGGQKSGVNAMGQAGGGGSGHVTHSLVIQGTTTGNVEIPSASERCLPLDNDGNVRQKYHAGYAKFYLESQTY